MCQTHKNNKYTSMRTFVIIVILLMSSAATLAQTSEDHVRDFINDAMQCHRNRFNPGVTVAVVKDGNTVFADGFGHIDGADVTSAKPSNTTRFSIASLTKGFAATLLVKLMHDANIPLYRYLKDSTLFDNSNLFTKYEHRTYATVKDVLSHRMGFPNHNFLRLAKTLDKDLYDICLNLEKKAAIRTSFYYNNIMYGLMTNLTEKLGGGSWESLMTSHVLQPIGMTDTTFARTADLQQLPDFANPAIDTEGTMYLVPANFTKKWADCAGSGSILASGLDMGKWMNFLLAKGKNGNDVQVVDQEVIDDVFDDENPVPFHEDDYFVQPNVPITFSGDVYLLGFKRGYYRGLPIYQHTGTTWGSSSMLMLVPSKQLGIFIAMTGRDNDYLFRTTALTHIADLYLGETPWINATQSCDFPGPYFSGWSSNRLYIDRDEAATRPLVQYVGTYTNTLYGQIDVTLESDGFLYLTYGWAQFKLYPRTKDNEPDEFYMEGQGILKNVMNFAECVFSFNGSQIDKLLMTKWEPSQVPEFDKI